jgi:crotonobetainyl-CoA:carnitine CoA-transferase CaiB-like acyl-CoA transferase
MQSAALTGLTVLDFTRVIAGPFLTQMLADLGADVIKVEAPGVGDDMRHYRPAGWKKDAPGFIGLNRNKRSIEIDITTDAGREICCALAEKSDILVENFRPDVMERYGLHYDALSKINSKLIYCSISGYGHTSPYRLVAGYDPIAQAESGMMYLTGPPGLEPQKAGGSIGDSFTGLHAGMGILAALQARHRTGRGQFVDVSLFDSMLSALGYVGSHAQMTGEDPPRMGNKSYALVPLGVFQCADGPIMIVVGNNRQFAKFCQDVLKRPDILADDRYASLASRLQNRDALETEIIAIFATNNREHWVEAMRAAGVPAGSVRSPQEAVQSPEAKGREMLAPVIYDGVAVDLVASPIKMSDTPVVTPTAIPNLGEHTDTILSEVLGLDAGRIETLKAAGAFGKPPSET